MTMTVPANGQFEWHILPSRQPGKTSGAGGSPVDARNAWRARAVRETRSVVKIERSQALAMALACGQAAAAARRGRDLHRPRRLRLGRREASGSGLRISFAKRKSNAVTVEVFRTSKGRKIVNNKRVASNTYFLTS